MKTKHPAFHKHNNPIDKKIYCDSLKGLSTVDQQVHNVQTPTAGFHPEGGQRGSFPPYMLSFPP